jgi:ribonuclease Z
MIHVSHLHADHHLGLISILREYATIQNMLPSEQRQPLFIFAPWRLFSSLYEYNQVENIQMEEYVIPFHSYNLIPRHLLSLGAQSQSLDQGLFQGFLSLLNLHTIETCHVPHCPQAYGIAITHKSGWKIVYSGDCRPSGDLVEIGRNATLVIHEATVSDSQPNDALDKMHCTTGQAIMIGKRMNAEHILLTHFSQKWSRVPEFVIDWNIHKEEEKYGNVGIAFDRMVVKLGELWKLPLIYPAFEVLYKDEKERKSYLKLKSVEENGNAVNTPSQNTEEPAPKRRKLERDAELAPMESQA